MKTKKKPETTYTDYPLRMGKTTPSTMDSKNTILIQF